MSLQHGRSLMLLLFNLIIIHHCNWLCHSETSYCANADSCLMFQLNYLPTRNSCPSIRAQSVCFRTDRRWSPCVGATITWRKMGCCPTCWEWMCFSSIGSWSLGFRSASEVTDEAKWTSLNIFFFCLDNWGLSNRYFFKLSFFFFFPQKNLKVISD